MAVLGVDAYLRPSGLEEALALLREAGPAARIVAGGTDLTLHPPPGLTKLIDLSGLELAYLREREEGLAVGAMTTLTDLLDHPWSSDRYDGMLGDMLRRVGSPLLRNVATLGGHLARGRLSDVVPVFLALDAAVTYFDGDHHTVPLADFYGSGTHHTTMILTETRIPSPPAHCGAAFLRFSRTAFDLALLNCACLVALEDGRIERARVVVGETPWLASVLPQVEAMLVGSELTPAAVRAAADLAAETTETGDDLRAGAAYRTQLVRVAVSRSLTRIAARLQEPAP